MRQTGQHNTSGTALIIGGGPAGLTAALELIRHSSIKVIVLESDDILGGISRTVNYRGNRIDIGGHRFFSKSDWVMKWWQGILPVSSQSSVSENSNEDNVMLVRPRLSRIFYERNFYDYPVKLNLNTIKNLGLIRMFMIGLSYLRAATFPKKEKNLEDFLINRFGRRLYETFFESYTEKVWGVACQKISPEWGAQRIKGLSVSKALAHFLLTPFRNKNKVNQKNTQTSLIERFFYPKFGPGQMWETVANKVRDGGGEILMRHRVTNITFKNNRIKQVHATSSSGEIVSFEPDWIISTMPIKDLINSMEPSPPKELVNIANGLPYRDFLTVGLLVSKMCPNAQSLASSRNNMPPDNWIYIQDPSVRLGRVQIFNNWSPSMVADPNTIWLGLEYFCNEGDDLWSMDDEKMRSFAAGELERIGLIDKSDVLDGVVIRIPKAYPAYFGTYDHFSELRSYLDNFENLYLIGRNGMHRYNNQDHSMLAAKTCVNAIVAGEVSRDMLWNVNAEEEYHEEKS